MDVEKLKKYRLIYPQLSDFEKKDWEENFLIEFTHDSTAIEGNTLSLLENKMIITDCIVPAEITLKELDEIRGHADAWSFVRQNVKHNIPISENAIRDIHERVIPMRGVGGVYRDIAVYIRGSQYIPPNPKKIWNLMGNFSYQIENDTFDDDIRKAAWLHAELVKIHPFQDGNGRTARLLMNYCLLENNYPPVSIKTGHKKEYFSALEEYSLNNNLDLFQIFLEQRIDDTLTLFIEMYEKEKQKTSLEELEKLYKEAKSFSYNSNIPLEFMKEVIKEYGADAHIINSAVNAVADIENESTEFAAKLLNDTLNSKEYRKAFEEAQGKAEENIR